MFADACRSIHGESFGAFPRAASSATTFPSPAFLQGTYQCYLQQIGKSYRR
jgi:hypothetical protein